MVGFQLCHLQGEFLLSRDLGATASILSVCGAAIYRWKAVSFAHLTVYTSNTLNVCVGFTYKTPGNPAGTLFPGIVPQLFLFPTSSGDAGREGSR